MMMAKMLTMMIETIKEIASAIKKLLDSVNEVSAYIPGTSGMKF